MGKLPMKLKTVINYLKSLKSHIGKDVHSAARYKLQKRIFNKNSIF